jgi:arginase
MHLVKAGLIGQIQTLGWKVQFDGHHQFEDISVEHDPPQGILKRPKLVSTICENVSKAVGKHIHNGALPLTLGGDHSLVSWYLTSHVNNNPSL